MWRILADEFVEISRWAESMVSWGANPDALEGSAGSPVGGRVCDVKGIGLTDERIGTFDPQNGAIGYSVRAAGLPSIIASMTNTWTVVPDGPRRSRVGVRINAAMSGPMGAVGAIPLRRMLVTASSGLVNDLKTYAESSAS